MKLSSVKFMQLRSAPSLPPCPTTPIPFNGLPYEKVIGIRKANLNPGLVTYYKKPVYISQGSMQWLWNHQGERYLDMFGGIVTVSVGHCHPKVNEALKKQVDTLWHTTSIYMHPKIHEYAERLVAKFPDPLKNVYFVNSGSEANDLAMFMARLHTGNFDIISFRNAYHGMSPYTMGLTAHMPWKFHVPTGFGIHHTMNPDPYKGLFGGSQCRDSPVQALRSCTCSSESCQASGLYMDQLEEVLKYSVPKGKSLAAFFAESIQGVGGTVQYPKGFLAMAFKRTREMGGVCVSDEVQTGFGRTGDHFWGFEGHGVVPDIVTLAKGIGNGFPMGAVVTTNEIASTMTQALHFNTFGGCPLASAVGLAVLDTIEQDGCQANCKEVGTYLLQGLESLRTDFEVIGDVRGKGLMIGVELVEDKQSQAPLSTDRVLAIWEDCKDMKLLFGKGGVNGNVFRLKPPMCITKQDVDFTIDVLRLSLQKNQARK